MYPGLRIKQLRKKAKISQKELADLIKKSGGRTISRTSISLWESTKTLQMTAEHLLIVAKILQVSPEWLQFGQGSVERSTNLEDSWQFSVHSCAIPFMDHEKIKKGELSKKNKNDQTYLGIDNSLAKQISPKTFAMPVYDVSLAPLLMPGDIVIIDPSLHPLPGDLVLILLKKSNALVLLKYRPTNHDFKKMDMFELIPLNNDWPKITIDRSNPGTFMGTVVEYRHKTRSMIVG